MKKMWGGQGLCRNAVDHIKKFDNDDPGCKILRQDICFAAWVIIIKIVNVVDSIPAQALAAPFDSHLFHHSLFSGFSHNFNFLQLGCFWLGYNQLCMFYKIFTVSVAKQFTTCQQAIAIRQQFVQQAICPQCHVNI